METTNNPTGETQLLDSTKVEQVEVNIDELFGNPGAENIMLPENKDEEKPKSLFSKEEVDTTFLDNPKATPEERQEAKEKKAEEKKMLVIKEDQRLINLVLLS